MDETGDECPVCMTAFGDRTEDTRSTFPCGHAVCSTCDSRMMCRDLHSCPLCRTPRDGFSRDEVERAAYARTLADAAVEARMALDASNGDGVEELMRSSASSATSSGGHEGWHFMFFASESNTDPIFDVFRTVDGEMESGIRRRRVRHSTRVNRQDLARDRVVVDDDIQELIDSHLLRPTDLATFQQRHREITRRGRSRP